MIAYPESGPALSGARWITVPGPQADNCTFLARRSFTLEELPERATLLIAAEARYAVYVNGRYVGSGPARGHSLSLFLRQLRGRRSPGRRSQHRGSARPLSPHRHHGHRASGAAGADCADRAVGGHRCRVGGERRSGASLGRTVLHASHRLLGVPRPAPRSGGLGGRHGPLQRLAGRA